MTKRTIVKEAFEVKKEDKFLVAMKGYGLFSFPDKRSAFAFMRDVHKKYPKIEACWSEIK